MRARLRQTGKLRLSYGRAPCAALLSRRLRLPRLPRAPFAELLPRRPRMPRLQLHAAPAARAFRRATAAQAAHAALAARGPLAALAARFVSPRIKQSEWPRSPRSRVRLRARSRG